MRLLVTGGAGFIGSHIVEKLVEQGARVKVMDNLSTGRLANLAPVWDSVEFVQGDIADFSAVAAAVDGVDFVLHQAALPSVPRSIKDPISSNEKNVSGTLNVLVAAKEAGVKRVVIASSSSVYGDTPALPKAEDMVPNPKSPYAVSKLSCEHYARVFWELYGLETVCLRYFNVFGPRQDPTSQYAAVIPRFITAMLRGEHPVIYGDGMQSRDFTFVQDAVQANLKALTAEGAAGHVFNVACSRRHTLNHLVQLLNEILDTAIEPTYTEPRPGDVRHSEADISRARQILGYEPSWSFEDGLRATVQWFKSVSGS